jgi:uncharacterized protein (DUF2062 family)
MTNGTPLKERLYRLWQQMKALQGEPRYIALGMAIGVFIGITPTIPFHTVIAVALAFILKASKPAAAVGVWIANPVTVPFFYYGSFKAGTFLLNKPIPFNIKFESIHELLSLGTDVTVAMIIGGALLGILPSLIAYVITLRFFNALREKIKQKKL